MKCIAEVTSNTVAEVEVGFSLNFAKVDVCRCTPVVFDGDRITILRITVSARAVSFLGRGGATRLLLLDPRRRGVVGGTRTNFISNKYRDPVLVFNLHERAWRDKLHASF